MFYEKKESSKMKNLENFWDLLSLMSKRRTCMYLNFGQMYLVFVGVVYGVFTLMYTGWL